MNVYHSRTEYWEYINSFAPIKQKRGPEPDEYCVANQEREERRVLFFCRKSSFDSISLPLPQIPNNSSKKNNSSK